MKKRYYIAQTDNGHDYSSFAFTSYYRAGSKLNLGDAKSAMRKGLGISVAARTKIVDISKIDENEACCQYNFFNNA